VHDGPPPHTKMGTSARRDPRAILRRPQHLFMQIGVLDSHSPDPTSFNKTRCTLILVEVGFYRDFGCDTKIAKKTMTYSPLIAAFNKYWGRVEIVALPIGHAGITLNKNLDHLTAAFLIVHPHVEKARASMGVTDPATDHDAMDDPRLQPI